jgi:CRP-like cAMP-binding protein
MAQHEPPLVALPRQPPTRRRASPLSGGEKEQTLATLMPGDFFGETALLDGYPRTASVQAVEKTECVALTRWDFMSELKGSPTMALEILRGLARRLRQCDASLME